MLDIPTEIRLIIINEKLQLYGNTIFSLTLDHKVALALNRPTDQIEKQTKDAFQAISILQKELEALEEEPPK